VKKVLGYVHEGRLQNLSDKILSALAIAADTVLLHTLLAQKNNNLPA
jgi:hypothetical protein